MGACVCAQLCLTLCDPTDSARLLCPWDFPGKKTGVGCHFLFQGIFLIKAVEPGPPALQADSLPSEPLGKPILKSISPKPRPLIGVCPPT